MAFNINDILLPNSLGKYKVKLNNETTNIVKFNVISGGTTYTVWESTREYYAYKNGIANADKNITDPYIVTVKANSGSYKSCEIINYKGDSIGFYIDNIYVEGFKVYGPTVTMRTPKLPVDGNTKFSANIYSGFTTGTGALTVVLRIFGVSADNVETQLLEKYTGSMDEPTVITDLNISSYSYIIIEGYVYTEGSNQYTEGPVNSRDACVCIKDARFYS